MSEMDVGKAVLELRDVSVGTLRDPALVVLEHVNWSVRRGEFWVVAGPHYSGKTDLLLQAAGLAVPASGECRVFGFDTKGFGERQLMLRLRVGFTFADDRLFNSLTIGGNVGLPLRYHKKETEADAARSVEDLLELLELTPYVGVMPGDVSVAWRRRAALARALVLKPELLLLDNPLGGLTASHRLWLANFLDQLWRGHKFFGNTPMTIVASTHDLRAWRHPERNFAAVQDGEFSVLGRWGAERFAGHRAIKELMTGPAGDIEALER